MTDFSITFFGTSIMEHLQAHSAVLDRQYDLPGIGEGVVIDSHRGRGWVHFLFLRLQAQMPSVRFIFDNQGLGGATTRDVLRVVRDAVTADTSGPDLAVLGLGINDVWRCFQNCRDQAVHLAEYRSNYSALLSALTGWAGQILCVTETPFGWDDTLDVFRMNKQLSDYNAAAMTIARQHGITVADLWHPVLDASRQFSSGLSPWSDGAHLSELGDTIVAREVEKAVTPLLGAHRREASPPPGWRPRPGVKSAPTRGSLRASSHIGPAGRLSDGGLHSDYASILVFSEELTPTSKLIMQLTATMDEFLARMIRKRDGHIRNRTCAYAFTTARRRRVRRAGG